MVERTASTCPWVRERVMRKAGAAAVGSPKLPAEGPASQSRRNPSTRWGGHFSAEHIGGVFAFIKEYLDSHADRTIGAFAASGTAANFDPAAARGSLRAKIWLQPFDQGVSQDFEIEARPSDIEDVAEITAAVARVSGPPAVWQRALPGFLEHMRKEFLLWRTLPDDVMDHYLNRAEKNQNGIT